MIEFLKNLLWKQEAFVGYLRAALLGLGSAQLAGLLPGDLPKWIGVVAVIAGGSLRAGQRNNSQGGA